MGHHHARPVQFGPLVLALFASIACAPDRTAPGAATRSLGRSLRDLDLSSTEFTETIPSTWADLLTILGSIYIGQSNQRPLWVPGQYGRPCDMMNLNMSGNAFVERTIPSELFRCRDLFKSALGRTSLGGTSPAGFVNLTKLAFVALDHTAVLGDAGNYVADLCHTNPY
jgi:hypothetical protein